MAKYLDASEVQKYCEFFDDVTETMIGFAETLIDEYVGDDLLETETTETHKINRRMSGNLEHKLVTEITSASAISVSGGGYIVESEVNPDDITVKRNGNFVYNGRVQPFSIGSFMQVPVTSLKITYKHGYKEVPAKLKQVVAMLAQILAEKRTFSGLKSWNTLNTTITLFDDSVFTKDIRMILDGLMR